MSTAFFAVIVALMAFAPTSALADTTRWLPGMPGFGDVVVDSASAHVFISPGANGSRILVRDLNGAATGSIASEPGATGMVLSGTKLYVALCEQSAISVIDTGTLTETERIPLGTAELSGTCDLGLAGGRLWFPTSDQWADVDSVTVAAPHTVVANALGSTLYDPVFATQTGSTSSLIIGTTGLSPSTVYTYNVGVNPGAQATSAQVGSNLGDLAVPASASHVVLSTGSPYYGQRFALPAITAAGTYTTGAYPTSAAVTSDGAWTAFGRSSGTKDLYVFGAASPTDVREFDLGTGIDPVARGTRFDAAASKLYAVGSDSSGHYALSVFDSPTSGSNQPAAPAVAAAPTAATPTSGATTFPLTGTPGATSLLVDAANSHVLVAPGTSGSVIQVRNLDGTAAGTIADTPGATSMVLSGGRIYVTLCGWNAIDVIDAATLAKVERIDLSSNPLGGKCQLGLAGGRLFYTDASTWATVRSVTLAAPHTFVANVLGTTYYQPTFSSSPALPGRLFLAETGLSTTTVEAWDVAGASVTRAASHSIDAYDYALATSAQGTATGVLLRDLRASDLSVAATYSSSYRGTMAYSPDGAWVANLGGASSAADVSVYARGDNQARRQFELVSGSGTTYAGTLAFSPTGDRLYAVASATYSPAAPTLYVIGAPTATAAGYTENTAAPTVTGSDVQGSTLTCAIGTWAGSPTYAYTWRRGTTTISGATAATYVTTSTDRTTDVSCTVKATTAAGTVSALASNAVTVVAPPAPPVAPTNSVTPSVSGTLTVGSTLTCAPGTWTGSPTFAYTWRRGGTAIPGATSAAYVTLAADGGTTLTCAVVGTNAGGSLTAVSAGAAIAQPAGGGGTTPTPPTPDPGPTTTTPPPTPPTTTTTTTTTTTDGDGGDNGGDGDTDDGADHDAPAVTLKATLQKVSAVLKSGLRVQTGCDEACSMVTTVEISAATARKYDLKTRVLATVKGSSTAGGSVKLTLRLSSTARAKFANARSVPVTVRIVAKDAAGNTTVTTKALVLGH